jgi:hypothetical protein
MVSSSHLSGGTGEKPRRISVTVVGVRAGIGTDYDLNTILEGYRKANPLSLHCYYVVCYRLACTVGGL